MSATKELKSERYNKAMPVIYATFYNILKDIAHKYGYALTLHGSMTRDLDLVAVPWVDETDDEKEMLLAMNKAIGGYIEEDGKPYYSTQEKPHGRVSYLIQSGCGYLDISIMPKKERSVK